MKHFLLLVIFTTFIANAYAQNLVWVEDSSRTFEINDSEWELTSRIHTNEIDEYGHLQENTEMKLIDGEWINSKKTTKSHFDESTLKYELRRLWNIHTNSWTDTVFYIENNVNSQQIKWLLKVYSSSIDDFSYGRKLIKTYNDENQLVLQKSYNWLTSESVWEINNKEESEYDENGNNTTKLKSLWAEETHSWYKSTKITLSYDEFGNKTQFIREVYNYSKGEWDNLLKNEYEYDDDGNLILKTAFNWNEDSAVWVAIEKNNYIPDSRGNLIDRLRSIWSDETETWINKTHYTYSYNTNGDLTSDQVINWNKDLSAWENLRLQEISFDEHNNKVLNFNSEWNVDTESWEGVSKRHYYWSEVDLTNTVNMVNSELEIYPNPTDGILHFNAENIFEVAIYSADGQFIKKEQITNEQLNISNLERGMYILEINNGFDIRIQKIFKN